MEKGQTAYFFTDVKRLFNYQKAVKTTKTQYRPNLVSNISHRPHVLFRIFNKRINPGETAGVVASFSMC